MPEEEKDQLVSPQDNSNARDFEDDFDDDGETEFEDFDDEFDDEDFEDDFEDDEPAQLDVNRSQLRRVQRQNETVNEKVLTELGLRKLNQPVEVSKSEKEAEARRRQRARAERIKEINQQTPESALQYNIYRPDKAGNLQLWGTWRGKTPRKTLATIVATRLKGLDGKGFTPGYYYFELTNPYLPQRYRGKPDSILDSFTLNIADDGTILPENYVGDDADYEDEDFTEYDEYSDSASVPSEDLAPKSHLEAILQQPSETVSKADLFLIMQENMRKERELERQHYMELEKIRARTTSSSSENNLKPETILQWIEIAKSLGIIANPQQSNPFPTEIIVNFMEKAFESVEKLRVKEKTADILKAVAGIATAMPGIIEATKPKEYSSLSAGLSPNHSQKKIAEQPVKKLTNSNTDTNFDSNQIKQPQTANEVDPIEKELLLFYSSAYTNFVNALSNPNIPDSIKEHNARPETATELAFVMLGNSEHNALNILAAKKTDDVYKAIVEDILQPQDKEYIEQNSEVQNMLKGWITKFLENLRLQLKASSQSQTQENESEEETK